MRTQKIGKYEKLEQIGHGSTSSVWLARDPMLRREVALKTIEAEVPDIDKLFEEPRIIVKLGEHPHIVRVYDADVLDGIPTIVMEYVKGKTLEECLNAEGKLSVDESLRILAQILLALETAHSNRVLHGDIKPANILLDTNGQAKVTDFGLSQILASHGYMQGAGTYAYMAPEDFNDKPATDIRKDIWSAGVILYRMLTGTRPYNVVDSRNVCSWENALETQTPRPLADFVPNAPAFLQGVVNRALHKDKNERFQSATAFIDALKTYGLYTLPLALEHRSRFEDAFNDIVDYFRVNLSIVDHNVGVPILAAQYALKHSDWSRANLLKEFTILRNYLAHKSRKRKRYLPLPSSRDIVEIEAIAKELMETGVASSEPITALVPTAKATANTENSVHVECIDTGVLITKKWPRPKRHRRYVGVQPNAYPNMSMECVDVQATASNSEYLVLQADEQLVTNSQHISLQQLEPYATIHNLWTDHNVWLEDRNTLQNCYGMLIHIDFDVHFEKGFSCQAAVFFHFDDASSHPVKSLSQIYSTEDMQLCTAEDFASCYTSTAYGNFVLFLPYDEFEWIAAGTTNLKFQVVIREVEDGDKELARSSWQHFQVTR